MYYRKLACVSVLLIMVEIMSVRCWAQGAPSEADSGDAPLRILFWNVENLFDTQNDSLTRDDEFTPSGERHWTHLRYQKKLNDIGKTIVSYSSAFSNTSSMIRPPAVVGLAEVENDRVLNNLTRGTLLRQFGYRYVHYDSPDRRGIDCALLYDPAQISVLQSFPIVVSDTTRTTRDILFVMAHNTAQDTFLFYVCHFPSRRGGEAADGFRMEVAYRLKTHLQQMRNLHPNSRIIVMGDFNSTSEEPFMLQGLGLEDSSLNSNDYYRDLMADPSVNIPVANKPYGSYCYQNQWSWIDHFIVSFPKSTPSPKVKLIEVPQFLFEYHEKKLVWAINRTYLGPQYHGGISDHLPICLELNP